MHRGLGARQSIFNCPDIGLVERYMQGFQLCTALQALLSATLPYAAVLVQHCRPLTRKFSACQTQLIVVIHPHHLDGKCARFAVRSVHLTAWTSTVDQSRQMVLPRPVVRLDSAYFFTILSFSSCKEASKRAKDLGRYSTTYPGTVSSMSVLWVYQSWWSAAVRVNETTCDDRSSLCLAI
ncbi:hypothetical protein HRR83_006157 [Exophiala dermatitidis]|uniref:Uncharacterized protein n=1 Tax=Exophiala dermatitidis TaxID=5970 RepID=A0AAN6ISE6_EXODE|nr:hypothetical protein HRR74_005553 [Exophiala dermatitidis]KAJ4517580.1 hypothetical protein HRR73_004632 [Exophiala dermatitidis]KAJ4548660.1 hypothetical protein HRR76_001249 [Exophiala dermatitidis]KAJ4552620.1 hypothetical protein HRR77_002621 [Exophiala dermatitidis]KAJ4567121.1 hypothetical protein HRR81_007197 [Exophiala dermatitidis]